MLELLMSFVAGGALAAAIKGIFEILKLRMEHKQAFPKTIEKMNAIYGLMDELKSSVNCDRVLICSTKNGGGIPRPGAHLYVSVLFETYNSNFVSLSEWWQNRQVDEQYVKMLSGLEDKGIIVLETGKMKKSMLKETYEAQEIQASILGKIKETGDNYYFICCDFKESYKINVPARVHLANYAQRIRDLI